MMLEWRELDLCCALQGFDHYKADIFQPYRGTFKKEGWLRDVQVVLGTAQLAGADYLAYRAIKKKPITKQ